ncbi:MAG: PEGA domain-containing protein [Candidatus Marinimicrobia bacterium]|nr:PEGA domain-containing protein [Candidatus Neomarinimicrobiota bacterium]
MKYRLLYYSVLVLLSSLLMAQDIMTIAVLNLDPRGLSDYEAASLTDRIRTNLVNLRMFEVVDRGNMEAILKEQEFQISGCTSSECVVEVGQLLGVQKMLAGSVGKIGTFYTLELNITDMQSGRIERSSSYEVEGNVGHLLKGSENALKKLLGLTINEMVRGQPENQPLNQVQGDGYSELIGVEAGGRIVIKSEPSGAILTMDGKQLGTTPFNMQNVPPGSHTLRLSKKEYQDMNAFVDVKTGQINRFSYNLSSVYGGLEIKCSVKDVKIYFDDKLRKMSSFPDYRIARGVYMLRVEHPHYTSYETTVNITSGDTVRVKPELTRTVGDIVINNNIDDAEIYINGSLVRKAYVSLNNIEPGVYQLSVKKDKYYTHNEKLRLKAGAKILKNIKLKPINGKIAAEINPAKNHTILFGNKKYSQQTLNKKKILIGNYNYEVSAPGYYPQSEKLSINENKTTAIHIILKSARQDYEKAGKMFNYGKAGGLGGAAFTALSYLMAEKAYTNYQDSRIEADTELYRTQTEFWDKMKVAGLSVTLGSGIFSFKKYQDMTWIRKLTGME